MIPTCVLHVSWTNCPDPDTHARCHDMWDLLDPGVYVPIGYWGCQETIWYLTSFCFRRACDFQVSQYKVPLPDIKVPDIKVPDIKVPEVKPPDAPWWQAENACLASQRARTFQFLCFCCVGHVEGSRGSKSWNGAMYPNGSRPILPFCHHIIL